MIAPLKMTTAIGPVHFVGIGGIGSGQRMVGRGHDEGVEVGSFGDGGVEEHRVEPHLQRLRGMAGQAKARIDHHGHLRKCRPQAAQPVQVVQPQP